MRMTELQLRLWCLWMCGRFAGLSGPPLYDAGMSAATEGASREMADMMWAISSVHSARDAWRLSERML